MIKVADIALVPAQVRDFCKICWLVYYFEKQFDLLHLPFHEYILEHIENRKYSLERKTRSETKYSALSGCTLGAELYLNIFFVW